MRTFDDKPTHIYDDGGMGDAAAMIAAAAAALETLNRIKKDRDAKKAEDEKKKGEK